MLWTALAAVAVLWPSRFIGPLDGAPLDGRLEAVAIGLVLPALWWLSRDRFRSPLSRATIVALLLWKALTGAAVQQQGLCMTATAPGPLAGTAMTMRIDEPRGYLRSWDLRADLWSEQPRCTAIITRPLRDAAAFPAWFVNITDQMLGRRDFTFRFTGIVTRDGVSRPVDQALRVTGEAMTFMPTLDGVSIFDRSLVTVEAPSAIDRFFAPWAWAVAPMLCLLLIGRLGADVVERLRPTRGVLLSSLLLAAAAVALASAPESWQRIVGALTLSAVLIPVRPHLRSVRGAFVLMGVPWLAFFAARSFAQIGRFSIYSNDDWLAYQAAGYRIFINGFWLEGGSPTFDYQPFYRWMTGALHLVFGDSSVGEVYWDATCLLIGALLAFQLVRMRAGFRAGILAAGAALATFTLGTPWYFLGRGLSEIAAAGWAFLAMWFLLRARPRTRRWIVAATLMTGLMFLSRLNHMLWVVFLPAMLLPLTVSMEWPRLRSAWRRLHLHAAAIYAAGFVAVVMLFMTRTWYYTGDFSLFYGTSLRHNDTGLRPWTLFDATVWQKVAHSLQSFVWMNEPARPDARAIIMVIGVAVALAACAQVPLARRLPAALVLTAVGSAIGAFFAHAHGYPGRFSIHAVPLASAMTLIVAASARPR